MILMGVMPLHLQGQGKDFKVRWDDGLTMTTADEAVTLSIGGRIQQDWAFIKKDQQLESLLGQEKTYSSGFRRLRFFQKGAIGENFRYKLQMDFAGGNAIVKDAYLHLTNIPLVGNIRVGHQKEFFSMEQIASSNDVVFMERSLGDNFIPTRNSGITLFDHYLDGRITWGAGVYRPTDGFGSPSQTNEGNFNLTGRIVGMPWRQDESHLLVIGSSVSRRDPDNSQVVYDSDPESSLAESYISTGTIRNVTVNTVTNYSLAAVYGPLSVQGEYMASRLSASDNMQFNGYYGQISFFLTGDNRNYNPEDGSFDGTIPDNNFNLSKDNGTGALELAVKYSTLDLADNANIGGELADITGGINWYLNPNSRIMFNYVLADVKSSGQSNVFQTRFQVTF